MSLTQQNAVALDTTFQGRVQQSVIRAATQVAGEDWVTAGHSGSKAGKRHVLAVKILSTPNQLLQTFYRAVAYAEGDVADQGTILDADIDTAVDSFWDDVAGVMFGE